MDYPRISSRIKAAVIDLIVLLILMVLVTQIFSLFKEVPETARIIAFVLIFGLYDPVFTSTFGGTIGHMMIGIRVKSEKDINKNIAFPFAVVRFLIKGALGWISFITVMSNEKGKAIHDIAVKSIVIYNT